MKRRHYTQLVRRPETGLYDLLLACGKPLIAEQTLVICSAVQAVLGTDNGLEPTFAVHIIEQAGLSIKHLRQAAKETYRG